MVSEFSSTSGTVTFYDTGIAASNANSLAPVGQPVEVPAITIDDLGLDDLRFVKLDIEGAEVDALRGATRAMATVEAMAIEVHPRQLGQLEHSTGDLWDLLSDVGASVMAGDRLLTRGEFTEQSDCFEVQVLLPSAGRR